MRRKAKRRFYRRPVARKFALIRSNNKVSKVLTFGMPNTYTCKLRYVTEILLNPETTGTPAVHVFRASDLYDPDLTATGHQPSGFDQLMQFYNHFVVLGSKINMTFHMKDGTNVTPGYYGITLTDSGTWISSRSGINQVLETEKTTKPYSAGLLNLAITSPAFMGRSMKYSLKRFFKVSTPDPDRFEGSDAASPSENAFYECWLVAVNNNDPGASTFLVTIDYIARFSGPRNLNQS